MSKTIIIAEAGVNHNGSIELAKRLVDAAAEAGADFVKFQTFKADKIASKQAQKADYQQKTTDKSESQLEMLKRLELSEEAHHELIDYCKTKNIAFLSTAFDFESIELLKSFGITLGKIPSGELTNLPFLRKMSAAFPQIILSTGMADLNEIKATIQALIASGTTQENLTVLHCNTEYPTPFEDVNLKAMLTIGEELGVNIGYSDHTLGIEVPIAAVALGAKVIEKHFTLDRNMEGPDHKASLEPLELKAMISAIRNIEKAMAGNGIKIASNSESKNKAIARKSIVAAIDIQEGEVFTEENLTVKRPGTGISPMMWDEVIGKIAKKSFLEDELIEL
ncbi:MAG: N-acetylneuraminate synthase [Spirosomaceae bacterium]|nr:N-acetylneuraminate synthase [Spirosomataceae bacterium]